MKIVEAYKIEVKKNKLGAEDVSPVPIKKLEMLTKKGFYVMSKSINDKIEEIWGMRYSDFPEEFEATKQLIGDVVKECLGEEEKLYPKDGGMVEAENIVRTYKNDLRQQAYKTMERLLK